MAEESVAEKIKSFITSRRARVEEKISAWRPRTDHFEMYHVLGISDEEALLMEQGHYKVRVVAANLGRLVEDALVLAMTVSLPGAKPKYRLANVLSDRPKKYEIDCLIDNLAVEIKFRETTTDGDHARKEMGKLKSVIEHGLVPVRLVMYGQPNGYERLYEEFGGVYLVGEKAWNWVQEKTGLDVHALLCQSFPV